MKRQTLCLSGFQHICISLSLHVRNAKAQCMITVYLVKQKYVPYRVRDIPVHASVASLYGMKLLLESIRILYQFSSVHIHGKYCLFGKCILGKFPCESVLTVCVKCSPRR